MPLETFLVVVYCHVCEAVQAVVPGGNPRSRGYPPKLSDAEALTMAFVGTLLGYRHDKAVWEYFRRHWAAWFPHLGDRSTFVRQLANLGHIKALLHRHWAGALITSVGFLGLDIWWRDKASPSKWREARTDLVAGGESCLAIPKFLPGLPPFPIIFRV